MASKGNVNLQSLWSAYMLFTHVRVLLIFAPNSLACCEVLKSIFLRIFVQNLTKNTIFLGMPCIEDWVSHPLNVIDGIGKESGSDTKEKVREFFAARFKAETRRIPSINDIPIEKLRPNSLVKFRCMVQDMFGPEYFLSQYEIVSKTSGKSEMRSGMYRDMADCPHSHEANFDSARNVTDEKNSYFCVPIPGETEWAKEGFGKKSAQLGMKASQTGQSNKRALDEEDMEQDQGKKYTI